MSTNTNVVIVDQNQQAPFGFVAVMIVCGFVALVLHFFWYIVAVAAIGLTVFVFWLLFQEQQLRSREVSVRAQEQNSQYLAGDPRGIFGDFDHEGLK